MFFKSLPFPSLSDLSLTAFQFSGFFSPPLSSKELIADCQKYPDRTKTGCYCLCKLVISSTLQTFPRQFPAHQKLNVAFVLVGPEGSGGDEDAGTPSLFGAACVTCAFCQRVIYIFCAWKTRGGTD